MYWRKNKLSLFILFSIAGFFLISCDKSVSIPVSGTSPVDDVTSSLDDSTVEVDMQTVPWDSVYTNNLNTDVIGAAYDAFTGFTVASAYGQLKLPQSPANIDDYKKMRSVKLYLRYSGNKLYKGITGAQQKWYLYELNQNLDGSDFYSNQKITTGNKIGDYSVVLNNSDSFLVIDIDTSFGGKLIRADRKYFADNNSFLNLLKGIAIVPYDITGSNLSSFILKDSSRMEILYNDSSKFILKFTGQSNRLATYKHSRTGTPAETQLKTPLTTYPEVYLASLSNLKVKITFKNIDKLARLNKAVLQAKLDLPQVTPAPDNELVPPRIKLFPRGDDGLDQYNNPAFSQTFIDDVLPNYGGKWNAATRSYSFIITHHIQDLIKRYQKQPGYEDKNGMNLYIYCFPFKKDANLYVPPYSITPHRLILNTRYATNGAKPKLKLILSQGQ